MSDGAKVLRWKVFRPDGWAERHHYVEEIGAHLGTPFGAPGARVVEHGVWYEFPRPKAAK